MLTSWHSRVPLAADVERIERVVRAYIARIETRNNVALCQAEMCETDDACDPVPRAFVSPLEPLPPLDDLLYVDDEENWRRAILQEEFASAVECPVEDMYAQEFVAAPSEA